MAVRNTVMKSLRAIGSAKEAAYYTQVFQDQEPEKFAIIAIDPRCLKNPLFEVLISDLKILSDLNLTPILLVGALDTDHTSVRYQSQRLSQALDKAGIASTKLNCASYEIIPSVKKICGSGRFVVLELTDVNLGSGKPGADLRSLTLSLKPFKVIFLQPSGGFSIDGKRLPVVNIDRMENVLDMEGLSAGQVQFIDMVREIANDVRHHCTYVMASPLNLLSELFTIKGAGTMLRRGAKVIHKKNYKGLSLKKLRASIENAFEKPLAGTYFKQPMSHVFVEDNYRGGAILTELSGLPYLSKFWVTKEAQGEGIAQDIWRDMESSTEKFFWRAKKDNPFNLWYMKICDGMQVSGEWRVFWKGLEASEVSQVVHAATISPIDFE